MLHREYWIPPV